MMIPFKNLINTKNQKISLKFIYKIKIHRDIKLIKNQKL